MHEFVLLFRSTIADLQNAHNAEALQSNIQRWIDWVAGLEAKGLVKDRGKPFDHGGCVVKGSELTVSQGPFVAGGDLTLGYLVVQARDMEHAIELTKGCSIVEDGGSVEIRPVSNLGF